MVSSRASGQRPAPPRPASNKCSGLYTAEALWALLHSITVAKVTDVHTYKSDNDTPLEEPSVATFTFK